MKIEITDDKGNALDTINVPDEIKVGEKMMIRLKGF